MKTNASDSFCASKGASFKQELQAMLCLIHRQIHIVERFVCRFYEGFKAGRAVITLIAFSIFAALAGFVLTVVTGHCELAFLWAMAHNQVARLDASNRFQFNKGSDVRSIRAFTSFEFQSPNYNSYITISYSLSQVKSYLTYMNLSHILLLWLNQRHGIGRCINVRGVSISGYLDKRRNIRMFAQSVKVLIGTSRARLSNCIEIVAPIATILVYNKRLMGSSQLPMRLRVSIQRFAPLVLWRDFDSDLDFVKPYRDYHESPRVANVIFQFGYLLFARWPGVAAPGFPLYGGILGEGVKPQDGWHHAVWSACFSCSSLVASSSLVLSFSKSDVLSSVSDVLSSGLVVAVASACFSPFVSPRFLFPRTRFLSG